MVYKKNTENKSQWKTEPLLKIIKRCEKFRGVNLNKRLKTKVRRTQTGTNTWSPLRIATSKTRGDGRYTGRCYSHNGNPHPSRKGNIYLGVPSATKYDRHPSKEKKLRKFRKERFAKVVLHEVDHLLGLKHSDMMDSSKLETPDLSEITVQPKKEHRISKQ